MRPSNEFFFFICSPNAIFVNLTDTEILWCVKNAHSERFTIILHADISSRRKFYCGSEPINWSRKMIFSLLCIHFSVICEEVRNRTKWKMECSLSQHAIRLQCHFFVSFSFRNENQKWNSSLSRTWIFDIFHVNPRKTLAFASIRTFIILENYDFMDYLSFWTVTQVQLGTIAIFELIGDRRRIDVYLNGVDKCEIKGL